MPNIIIGGGDVFNTGFFGEIEGSEDLNASGDVIANYSFDINLK